MSTEHAQNHAALLFTQQCADAEKNKNIQTALLMSPNERLRVALDALQTMALSPKLSLGDLEEVAIRCLESVRGRLLVLAKQSISSKWGPKYIDLLARSVQFRCAKFYGAGTGSGRCSVCNTKECGSQAVDLVSTNDTSSVSLTGDMLQYICYCNAEMGMVDRLLRDARKKELPHIDSGRISLGSTCLALSAAHWVAVHMLGRFVKCIIATGHKLSDADMTQEVEDMTAQIDAIESIIARGRSVDEDPRFPTKLTIPSLNPYPYEESIWSTIDKHRCMAADHNSAAEQLLVEHRGDISLQLQESGNSRSRRACVRACVRAGTDQFVDSSEDDESFICDSEEDTNDSDGIDHTDSDLGGTTEKEGGSKEHDPFSEHSAAKKSSVQAEVTDLGHGHVVHKPRKRNRRTVIDDDEDTENVQAAPSVSAKDNLLRDIADVQVHLLQQGQLELAQKAYRVAEFIAESSPAKM